MFTLHRVPRPAPDAPVHPLLHAHATVDRAVSRELYGHDDFAESAEAWSVHLLGSPDLAADIWVALPEGVDPDACAASDGLGYAELDRSLTENLGTAELYVAVRPDARGEGIGRALYEAASAVARADGRSVEQSWAFSPALDPADPDALPAASGTGAVDGRLPGARLLLSLGFELEQAERLSTLRLADPGLAGRAEALRADAEARAADYEVVTWRGAAPEELRDGLAELFRTMSVDIPNAGLDADEERWDADRVARQDARSAAKGRDKVSTAARHRPTGELAGFTELVWPVGNPAGVWQEMTVVLRAHRGHRLGALIKAENLTALRAANPDAERIHTWNAAENRHMLAINDALGFEVQGLEGAWQRRG